MTATIGVYVLRDGGDAPLYVGSSGDVAQRVRNHAAREWWSAVERVEVYPTETRDAAFALEAQTIRDLNPVHNIYRPRSTGGKRPRVEPPAVRLGDTWRSLGLTDVEVARRAAISVTDLLAFEGGFIALSPRAVAALEAAIGAPPGSIHTGATA